MSMYPPVGQPVAQPIAQPAMQKMRVTVPQGVSGGQSLRVQTPSGLMQVIVPDGLTAGQTFDMMVPNTSAAQPAVATATPTGQPQYSPPPQQYAPPPQQHYSPAPQYAPPPQQQVHHHHHHQPQSQVVVSNVPPARALECMLSHSQNLVATSPALSEGWPLHWPGALGPPASHHRWRLRRLRRISRRVLRSVRPVLGSRHWRWLCRRHDHGRDDG
mmetsp:Transcript_15810/g.43371  ORF Transcript_15810/g.43371 Transcript_15810/m.43371 type:complete len:215 (+) Transcript_15810:284-928(+)